LELKSDKYGK